MERSLYQTLPGADSFRVLELQPGQEGELLQAQLREVRLLETPEFCALSYCWGAPEFDSIIHCNESVLYITRSLANALECLRQTMGSLVIWIDQICINQEDAAERSAQVQLMREIYSSATDVLVWLGMPTESSDFLFSSISRGVVAYKEIPPLMCALADFWQRQWFERTWTVQEVVLSWNEPLMFCGQYCFPWSQLNEVLSGVYQRFSQREPLGEGCLFPNLYERSINDINIWKIHMGEQDSRVADEKAQKVLKSVSDGAMAFSMLNAMRIEGASASFTTQFL